MLFSAVSVIVAAATLATAAPMEEIAQSTTISGVQHTFYGYPDNSPPGAGIAYDCGRGYTAGGTGTYSNPLTFATAPGEFNKCEIIYDVYTEKYLRFEDTCEQCTSDWNNGQYHIDIWTGSSTQNGGQAQINCEDDLTPDKKHQVIRNPGSSRTVNSGVLYSPSSGCHTNNVYPNSA